MALNERLVNSCIQIEAMTSNKAYKLKFTRKNVRLTDLSASSGHSWNQSICVQLTTAGNLRPRTRNVEPTGEKQSTTLKK